MKRSMALLGTLVFSLSIGKAQEAAPEATATNSPAVAVVHVEDVPSVKSSPRRAAAAPALEKSDSLYDLLIAERLSLGAVYVSTSMKKTHVPYDPSQEGNFLGNINNLEEDGMGGIGLVARYNLCRYIALQFSTGTHIELGMWNKEHESRDANFVADGTSYELLLMCPIDALHVTPYVGIGFMDLSCDIDYNNWWHYGWSSPRDYEVYGHGSTADRNGTSRWMFIEEPGSATTFSIGLSLNIWRHAQIDLFYRTISADDCTIAFDRKIKDSYAHMRDGYVPLECSSYGAALRAVF